MKTLLAALFSVSVYASSIGVNANIQLNGNMVQSCSDAAECDISYNYYRAPYLMPLNSAHATASGTVNNSGMTMTSWLYTGGTGYGLMVTNDIRGEWDGTITFDGTGQGTADLHIQFASDGQSLFNPPSMPSYYLYWVNGILGTPRGLSNRAQTVIDTISIPVTFGVPTPIALTVRMFVQYTDDGLSDLVLGLGRSLTASVQEAQSDIPTIPNPEPSTMVLSLLPIFLFAIWRRIWRSQS